VIDIAAPLQAAIKATLLASPAMIAVMPAGKVRVFDVLPRNVVPPYIIIGADDIAPIRADGFELSEAECTIQIWSLTDPPGLAQAKAIGAALSDTLLSLPSTDGCRIYASDFRSARYLTDPGDNLTAHGIVTLRFTASPS
jgi:hypothetical protein